MEVVALVEEAEVAVAVAVEVAASASLAALVVASHCVVRCHSSSSCPLTAGMLRRTAVSCGAALSAAAAPAVESSAAAASAAVAALLRHARAPSP